jgi:hypothetical protein
MGGALPLMTAVTNNLIGLRYINFIHTQSGNAPIGGTYRLSFRSAVTEPISAAVVGGNYNAIAADIGTKLGNLDTISANGVVVTRDSSISSSYSQLWRITFVDPELGGNVEPIQVVKHYNMLTGTDVAISIFTDGLESAVDRGNAPRSSKPGNELMGQFQLSYRGHTTEPIDFNAADTDIQVKIEELPKVRSQFLCTY